VKKLITLLGFILLLHVCLKAQMLDSISQYGITWRFNMQYQCGQFVNGDWWVVGPVTINSVSPDWDTTRNGTMINPMNSAQQGYDIRVYGFTDSLRVRFPKVVNSSSSVISVIGLMTCASGGAAECISDAAVLTVLSSAPANGSFRPAYFGSVKTIFDTSQVNYGLLPKLPQPSQTPPVVTNEMVRPWLDHGPKVSGAKIHPQNNMPPYPRDLSVVVSRISVMALLNIPQQHEYANRLIQLGIDLYPISLVNDDAWRAYGGFGSGRKWPILFSGLLLNNTAMQHPQLKISTIPYEYKFGEDGFTYYGQPTVAYPNGKPLWGRDCIADGYTAPFFGNHDCRDPNGILEAEQMTNGGGYRICCTSQTWVGAGLAAQLLCADSLWNHNEFFDYIDRWTNDTASWSNSSTAYYRDFYGYGGDGGEFMTYMWKNYRPYGDSPSFTASANDTICSGQNITMRLYGIDTAKCVVSWNGGAYVVDTFFTSSPSISSNILASVKYKNNLGCSATHQFDITVKNCSGINTFGKTEITVVPNPTAGEITFYGLDNFSRQVDFKLYNLLGELVYGETIIVNSANKFSIDLRSLSIDPGLYFVGIVSGSKISNARILYTLEK